jgi:CheY-like chemotaxis protein
MMHILVVDDERDMESLFRQQFRKEIRAEQVYVHFASSAKEALELMGALSLPDLVLSDINMPEMSGLELLRTSKQRYPQVPVIMVTAFGDEENRDAAKQYGANGFFSKPVDFTMLRKQMLDPETV